tara:strand:+ start:359 stop:658 length:300 start_codon:yes stop_codon:yes gene_type:complete
MPKHSQKLIDKAHDLAFRGELSNKAIAKKLKLTANQLHYILYAKQDSGYWIEDVKEIMKKTSPAKDKHGYYKDHEVIEPKKEPTITESFLDFFILDKFR